MLTAATLLAAAKAALLPVPESDPIAELEELDRLIARARSQVVPRAPKADPRYRP